LMAFAISGCFMIVFILILEKIKRKHPASQTKQGILFHWFLVPCYSLCMILCIDYLRKIFMQGEPAIQNGDVMYLFSLMFSIKGLWDIFSFIKISKCNVGADTENNK